MSRQGRPLEALPSGLRASTTRDDMVMGAFFDFSREIGIPEGPHYHRGIEWSWEGDMEGTADWSISYDERAVSSAA